MPHSIHNVKLLTTDSKEWRAYVKSSMASETSYRNRKYSDLGAIHAQWFENAIRADLNQTTLLQNERVLTWQARDLNGRLRTYYRELDGVLLCSDVYLVIEIKFSLSKSAIKSATRQVNIASQIFRNRYDHVSTLRVFGDGSAYCSQLGKNEELITELKNNGSNTVIEFPWVPKSINAETSYISVLDINALNSLCERYPHPFDELDSYKEI